MKLLRRIHSLKQVVEADFKNDPCCDPDTTLEKPRSAIAARTNRSPHDSIIGGFVLEYWVGVTPLGVIPSDNTRAAGCGAERGCDTIRHLQHDLAGSREAPGHSQAAKNPPRARSSIGRATDS